MSAPPPPSARRPQPAIAYGPLLAWLVLQLLALLISAFRVPLSARFPAPEERLAVHVMLCVQMLASALLFPGLFRTRATGAMTIVSTPVMLLLAGMLAAELDRNALMAVSAYSMLWLLSLAIWARVLRDRRAEMVGVATMLLLSAGGAFAAYLNREFAGQAQAFDWPAHGYLGSIVGALTLLETGPRTGTPWAFLGTLFGFGMATLGAFRLGSLRAGKNA